MKSTNRREFLRKAFLGAGAFMSLGCLMNINTGNMHSCISGLAAMSLSRSHKMKSLFVKEAKYYTRLERSRVRCDLCYRKCIITEYRTGFCRVRENVGGKLYSLVYGHAAGLQTDPIEMEPMYHMLPGHNNLCVFTASCNFRCKHCHNWHISQRGPAQITPRKYSAQDIVNIAKRRGCRSISHSINEPTVFFEYMYDIARAARDEGLLTLFHTNGYISPEPLRDVLKYMNGVTVDLKAFDEGFYNDISSASLKPVLDTLKIIRQENVHLEIVNLIIPTLNDSVEEIDKMSKWINKNIGSDIPLHFNRFSPTYQLTNLSPTPVSTLEAAADKARQNGLRYVYIGNVPGHDHYSTYCPGCEKLLISRTHFSVLSNELKNGRCSGCGLEIYGIWQL